MNNGLEGMYHNSIWADSNEPAEEPEPVPPSFDQKMEEAQNTLRKKIEELIRAREKRAREDAENG